MSSEESFSSIEVPDSENENEEEVDDEDDYEDERCFSPRTRMSITGIRPSDLTASEDEEEDHDDGHHDSATSISSAEASMIVVKKRAQRAIVSDSEDEDEVSQKSSILDESAAQSEQKAAVKKPAIVSDSEDEADQKSSFLDESAQSEHEDVSDSEDDEVVEPKNPFLDQSAAEDETIGDLVIDSGEESELMETSTVANDSIMETSTSENILNKSSLNKLSRQTSQEEYESDKENNDSVMNSFTENIKTRNSLSSTKFLLNDLQNSRIENGSILNSIVEDDSAETVLDSTKSSETSQNNRKSVNDDLFDDSDLEIEEISKKMETSTISINDHSDDDVIEVDQSPVPRNHIQPKIKNAFSNVKVKVSEKHYQSEVKKLDELKVDLEKSLQLQKTLKNRLSDSGEKMERRVSDLKLQILKQQNYLNTLEIQETINIEEASNIPKPLNWDDIKKLTTDVQPIYTGKVGMKNFENQKTLTLERLKDLHSSLEARPTEDILVPTPKDIQVELMPHQMHGLAWMLWREKQKPRGGILADDMGLGKTLTVISLIIESNNREKEMNEEEKAQEESESSESDEEDEKLKSKWAAKGRRDYYYGGTLIVCPASLINQWEGEIKKRTKRNLLSVEVYHGSNRESKPRRLAKNDVVITTYNIVSREAKEQDTLFQIKFDRVVLDEAHQARNHKSKTSEGVCLLKGKNRWALTGTPIQNKEMDLYAILKFLKCTPFNDLLHWKRWVDNSSGGKQRLHAIVQTIMLRRTKDELQERKILKMPVKTIQLIDVVLDKEEMNVYQKILIYSKTLLGQYLHQKAEKDNDRNYYSQGSRPTFMQVKDPNGAYFKAHEKLSRQFKQTAEVKTHQILSLLLRLRQICCHPGLIDAMLEDDNSQIEAGDDDSQIDLLEHLNKLNIDEATEEEGETDLNSSSVDRDVARTSARCLLRSNPVFSFDRPSAKIRKVLELLKTILETSDKIVIVSQWTGVLEILGTHLEKEGIKFVFLTGKVLVKDRHSLVNNFNNPNTETRIMLLSLTAGGVGLNLVGANHLMLMDLHWNPQLESQAQDRIYRVGQKKPVNIYKLMCSNTVEERIKALQEHKLELASAVLTGKSHSGGGLSMEDLRTLFSM